ncbi:ABC transporter permease [Shouchella patagoniensis]|uniref:ABC transporter permease n=1 Tax=Shouchella patagoniensis TaxID=228576 RepID=UPI001473D380|nr:ABC transporter permease [Shouchella patagoniensis]
MRARGQGKRSIQKYFQNKQALVGTIIIAFAVVFALFPSVFAPYDPNVVPEGSTRLLPPGSDGHVLGTDQQGRDLLSRIVFGTQVSLLSAIVPVFISAFISLLIGVVAGYYKGWIGTCLMRVMDVFFAFPAVLLAIAIAAILGPGLLNVMIAMVIVRIPYMTRVVYTDTMQESEKEYIEAARAFGMKDGEILFRQLIPNVLPSLIVYATTLAGVTIVTVAGLSFIGLGVQPPNPDWGRMASEGSVLLMQGYPHITFIPGLAIILLSFAFSLVGDGLRDAIDPRVKQKPRKRGREKAIQKAA